MVQRVAVVGPEASFFGRRFGVFTVQGIPAMQIKVFEGHRVELVEEAANHWLKAHPTIEVLKIEPTFPVLLFPPDVGATHPYEHKFVLTIWYREQP